MQRMFGHRRFGRRRHLLEVAELEPNVEPVLEGRDAELVQTRDLRPSPRQSGDIGERGSPPAFDRVAELRHGTRGISAFECLPAGVALALEDGGVQLRGVDRQRIGPALTSQPVGTEQSAQQ